MIAIKLPGARWLGLAVLVALVIPLVILAARGTRALAEAPMMIDPTLAPRLNVIVDGLADPVDLTPAPARSNPP